MVVKKKIRFLTQMLTAAALSISPIMTVSAEETMFISINGSSASENEITTVTASAEGGAKAAAFSITLDYDSSLLEFVDAKSLMNTGMFCYNPVDEDTVKIVWSDDKDSEIDGDIFNVSFKTRGETDGNETEIIVGDTSVGNADMNDVPFDAQNGIIKISADYKRGDANCDGSTDIADVVAIDKYCTDMYYELPEQGVINADMNNDTLVNELDSVRVMEMVQNNSKEAMTYEG